MTSCGDETDGYVLFGIAPYSSFRPTAPNCGHLKIEVLARALDLAYILFGIKRHIPNEYGSVVNTVFLDGFLYGVIRIALKVNVISDFHFVSFQY